METTDNPIRQTLNVNLNLCVNFRSPRRKASPVLIEAVDGFLTEVSNEVHGLLEGHPVVMHHDRDHVVRDTFGLFTIVREEVRLVLENVENENRRNGNDRV